MLPAPTANCHARTPLPTSGTVITFTPYLNPAPKTQQGTSNVLHGTLVLNTHSEVDGMWGLSADYMLLDR
jgi:hypothetical protein